MFHPLLENNLKKGGLRADALPSDLAAWGAFLESLSLSYSQIEQDRSLLEHSLSLASDEMRQEITDRKRVEEALAEERNLLRTLIDAMPDYIYIKDQESCFVIGNTATALSLGAPPPKLLSARPTSIFMLQSWRPGFMRKNKSSSSQASPCSTTTKSLSISGRGNGSSYSQPMCRCTIVRDRS